MKRPALPLFALLGLLGLALLAPPNHIAAQSEDAPERKADRLNDLMEESEDLLRSLRSTVRDSEQNDTSVEAVVKMQANMLEAKGLIPPRIAAMEDDAAREEERKAYQAAMADLLRELCTLEMALLQDRQQDAMAALKAVFNHRFKGHNRFRDE